MTINEYQKMRFTPPINPWRPSDSWGKGIVGLNGETNEGIDILKSTCETVVQTNLDKLRARYPDGFDTNHSLHCVQNDN